MGQVLGVEVTALKPALRLEIPALAGKVEPGGSLADFIWFRTGGPAEWLVRPDSVEALAAFLSELDPAVPVLPVGVGSNLIVRDGGIPGVVVRLPKAMAKVSVEPGNRVRAGGAAMGITVASAARDAGIAGLRVDGHWYKNYEAETDSDITLRQAIAEALPPLSERGIIP